MADLGAKRTILPGWLFSTSCSSCYDRGTDAGFAGAGIGRFFIGGSVAVAFVGLLKLASSLTSIMLVGWAIGGPFFGWLSDRTGKRKPLFIAGIIGLFLGWILILFFQVFSILQLTMLLFLTGFLSGCMIISFAFVTESVPLSLSGTVSGLTNMGVMMGPMLLQPVVGKILDTNWAGQMVNGVRFYPVEAYEYGFIPMIGWVCISVALLFLTKETNCRQIS